MKPLKIILLFVFLGPVFAYSQIDSTEVKNRENVKSGWVPDIPIPVVAYDADMGFQYGIIGSIHHYGDGTMYPEYKHKFLIEVSRFTKGSGVNQLFYDSKYLLPKNIRITADLSFLTEQTLNFYGFNGYETVYNPDLEDKSSDDYISRVFYRYQRKWFRFILDFQGNLKGDKLRWLAGMSFFNYDIETVDIERLNKGKPEEKILPDIPLLYDQYFDWDLIPQNEKHGGQINFFKLGLVYDTRDNEPNPGKGIWEEVIIMTAPSFFFNKEFSFTKLAVTHRHYLSLVSKKLTLAYRLSYQGTIGGKTPFFSQSYLISSFSTATKSDGLGGAKTLRGVLRNRSVGDGILFGNMELRWKFFRTIVLNQNLYIALHGFFDAGQTVQQIKINKTFVPEPVRSLFFDQKYDSMHLSYGAGLRIALNENFILAIDYGIATDKRDGLSGLYIGINNLF